MKFVDVYNNLWETFQPDPLNPLVSRLPELAKSGVFDWEKLYKIAVACDKGRVNHLLRLFPDLTWSTLIKAEDLLRPGRHCY